MAHSGGRNNVISSNVANWWSIEALVTLPRPKLTPRAAHSTLSSSTVHKPYWMCTSTSVCISRSVDVSFRVAVVFRQTAVEQHRKPSINIAAAKPPVTRIHNMSC